MYIYIYIYIKFPELASNEKAIQMNKNLRIFVTAWNTGFSAPLKNFGENWLKIKDDIDMVVIGF